MCTNIFANKCLDYIQHMIPSSCCLIDHTFILQQKQLSLRLRYQIQIKCCCSASTTKLTKENETHGISLKGVLLLVTAFTLFKCFFVFFVLLLLFIFILLFLLFSTRPNNPCVS